MCSEYNKLKMNITHCYSGSVSNLLIWKSVPKYSQVREKVFVFILQEKLVSLVMMAK